ncbi:MAG TPA: TonB-dependent receptor, partial [Caulobacteraceae bacterium]|nr:TonB-dependent receptor [Caulobacteraceae bacterium]
LTIAPSPNFLIFNEYDQAFSHELDFTSTDNSPFQYVGGLYWYRERYHQPVDAYTTTQQGQMFYPQYYNLLIGTTPNPGFYQPVCAGGGFATCAAPINEDMSGSSDMTAITYDSLGIFFQGSYRFSDQFKFTGGIRYTNDHKSGYQTWRVISFDSIVTANGDNGPNPPGFLQGWGGATPALDITSLAACTGAGPPAPCEPAFPGAGPTRINPVTGNAERTLGATWGAVTGQAILDWTPNPDTLVYAKYSRGYKSGGWSTYTLAANPEVGPEFVDAFEIGAKQQFAKTLTANGDIFYYNYYGEQVPLSVVNQVTQQIVPILYNVPQARNYGLELWGTWRPIDPLAISLSYSYLSAKVTKSACVQDTTDPQAIQPGANTTGCGGIPGAQNIVGQYIPGATPNKISVNGLYTWHFDPGKLTLSGTFIWRDGTFDSVFNRSYTFQPNSTQVNLRLTWNDAKDRFTIIAFCDNLFDTSAYDGAAGVLLQSILPDPAHGIAAQEHILSAPFLNAPRTFGLQFQYRWR